jgi:hypothetical protein
VPKSHAGTDISNVFNICDGRTALSLNFCSVKIEKNRRVIKSAIDPSVGVGQLEGILRFAVEQ